MTTDNTGRAKELDYHVARVLLLVVSFTKPRGGGIDGLTKLAKLDFLIRYPVMLERLAFELDPTMDLRGSSPTDAERLAVESRMVRYKFGPWDDNYYPIVGALIGMGLIQTVPGRGRIAVRATPAGAKLSESLARDKNWRIVALRCRLTARHFDMSGNSLKELIYASLPEAINRPHRSMI
ncbi:hypothetical protein GCM10020216_081250 [Nonomuraea helvata]